MSIELVTSSSLLLLADDGDYCLFAFHVGIFHGTWCIQSLELSLRMELSLLVQCMVAKETGAALLVADGSVATFSCKLSVFL